LTLALVYLVGMFTEAVWLARGFYGPRASQQAVR
jgi:hypothetical protein